MAFPKQAAIALTLVLGLALAFGMGWRLASQGSGGDRDAAQAELMKQLIARTPSALDSHPDVDIGHTLLPNHEAAGPHGERVVTGPHGLRERAYALPKPEGLLRVVLLGDSFIMGWGVEADERVAHLLEAHLRSAAGPKAPEFECLSIAVISWNIRSATSFLRRHLDELQPDLVLHVTVPNDLDDVTGVRGFGGPSGFDPAHPERAGVRVRGGMPARFGHSGANLLAAALDFESRSRYRAAGAAARRLADEVERLGGSYRLIAQFGSAAGIARSEWAPLLGDERLLFLPPDELGPEFRLGADPHWNAAGHARVAELLYGLVLDSGWLPELDLAPSAPEAQVARDVFERGRAFSSAPLPATPFDAWLTDTITLPAPDAAAARQIYGGLESDGRAAPYVSFVLRNKRRAKLRLVGSALPHGVLAGATVRVLIDGEPAGTLTLQPNAAIDARFDLPPGAGDVVHVQLEASDFVYTDAKLRRCTSLRLERMTLED